MYLLKLCTSIISVKCSFTFEVLRVVLMILSQVEILNHPISSHFILCVFLNIYFILFILSFQFVYLGI